MSIITGHHSTTTTVPHSRLVFDRIFAAGQSALVGAAGGAVIGANCAGWINEYDRSLGALFGAIAGFVINVLIAATHSHSSEE